MCTLPTNLDLIGSQEDIDKNIEMFTDKINAAVRYSVPLRAPKTNFLKLPQFILNLIKTRNYYRRQWSRYRQLSDHEALTRYSVEIRKKIFEYRNASWNKNLVQLKREVSHFGTFAK